MDPLTLRFKVPAHVAAIEIVAKGTKDQSHRIHGFLRIAQRDQWIADDRDHREALLVTDRRVMLAWNAFSIVLHAEPKGQKVLWNWKEDDA